MPRFKALLLVSLMLTTTEAVVPATDSALEVAERILGSEHAPCFVLSGRNNTFMPASAKQVWFPVSLLDNCDDVCCNHAVLFLHGLDQIGRTFRSLGHLRMYFVVNLLQNEDPSRSLNIRHDNIVLLQTITGPNRMLDIYEKKQGKFLQTSTWNGARFSREPFVRSFEGETLRVTGSMGMPFIELYTDENEQVHAGSGVECIFFKAVSAHDKIPIEWIDITYVERERWGDVQWGTLWPNGSATGMLNYTLEYKTDIASMGFYFGFSYHKNIWYGFPHDYEGLAVGLLNPKPSPSWQGLVTPYGKWAWISIAATVIAATFVLALCHRISLNSKKNDWPLHFLDALNPMAGRPMCVPGFDAAHLGQEKKILAFDIFLLTYSLACLVINTGYEGNLKSHLAAINYPPQVKTLKEFAAQQFDKIVYLQPDATSVTEELSRHAILEVSLLPQQKDVIGRRGDYFSVFYEPLKGNAIIAARKPAIFEVKRLLTRSDGNPVAQIVPQMLQGFPLSFLMTRMNRFHGLINRRGSQWMQGGFWAIHMKWIMGNVKSVPFEDDAFVDEGNEWEPLVLDHFRLLFGFFGCGLMVSLVVFIVEKYFTVDTRRGQEEKRNNEIF